MPPSKKATKRKVTRRASKSAGAMAPLMADGSSVATVTISQPQAFLIDTSNQKFKAVLMWLIQDEANVDAVYHLIKR
jgi:hypothetical protein